MAEQRTETFPYKIKMICNKCGKGEMKPTGNELVLCPPKFPHKCTSCGNIEAFNKRYPLIEYRE